MARGQAQAATNQLNTTNANAAQQQGQATQLENTLIPNYTSMMTGQLNPAQQQAVATGEGAVASSYDAAGKQAQQQAARTGNAAALPAQQDQLALDKGQAIGNNVAGTTSNLVQQNIREGQQGLQSLYGTNQGAANSMYGLGPSTLQARAAGMSGDQEALGYINAATKGLSG